MDTRLHTLLERSADAWLVSVSDAQDLLTLANPKAVRINPLKAKKSTLKDIKSLGVRLEPISWCPNAYTVIKGYEKLSKSDLFTSGAFILQDPASFVPVLALDPKSGEDILDICAAPGGKTTHIAAVSKNKARIVANDTSRSRFFKMRDMFNRYGVRADTTLYDGRFLRKSLQGKLFDKILLDAPCSGEAAINPSKAKSYEQWSLAKVKRLSRLQEQLIAVAYDVLQPGGTLVYSTCTIAPEENELVIDYLLKKRGAELVQLDIPVTGARPALTSWNGKQLNPQLAKAYRLLPNAEHEAFFVAKIRKPLTDKTTEEDTYQM